MSEKTIEEKVKDIIVEQLGVNPEQVTSTASFIEDLGADSLDTVELVMAFEEEFNVEVPDEGAEKLQTVDLADRLELLGVFIGVFHGDFLLESHHEFLGGLRVGAQGVAGGGGGRDLVGVDALMID